MRIETTENKIPANAAAEYCIKKDDLPLSCPTKDMVLWSAHPRVYLPISEEKPEVVCPYCDAKFILID